MSDSDPKKRLSGLKWKRITQPKTSPRAVDAGVPNGDRPRRGRRGSAESTPGPDPIIKGEYSYVVGKVEEVKVLKGGTKKTLYLGPGRVLLEEKFPFLRNHEKGTLIALHTRGEKPVTYEFAEALGMAGTISAELARHAYSIGNGVVFPPPVEAEAKGIETEGQAMIDKELREKKLRSANDANWRTECEHGKDRADFRGLKDTNGNDAYVTTIDPDTAKDHDDALHARRVKVNGKDYVEVGVHIADVTHFISALDGKPGHAMFNEAMVRSLTAYFPTQAFTMLPRILAEKLCSLEPGADRLALSTVFLIDPETEKIDDTLTWYGEGVINSGHHFSYRKAEELRVEQNVGEDDEIEIDEKNKNAAKGRGTKRRLQEGLHLLEKYALVLRKEREDRKSASFDQNEELDPVFDPRTGKPVARKKKSYETNLIIRDWMVRANEAFATLITRTHEATGGQFPTLLRYHEPPALKDLLDIAERFDATDLISEIKAYQAAHPTEEAPRIGDTEAPFQNKVVDRLFDLSLTFELSEERKQAIRDTVEKMGELHPYYEADPAKKEENIQRGFIEWTGINRDWLRQATFSLFTKAKYTTDPSIHFGLSLFPYTHATSPIRRFADVIVHYLVKAAASGNTSSLPDILKPASVKKIATHMNAREIMVREASDQSERMWGAHLLSGRKGEDITGRVGRIRRKPIGGGRYGPRLMIFQVALEGGYKMDFDVPIDSIEKLPPEAGSVNNLIGHDVTFKLLGVDLATGELNLKFVSAPEGVTRVALDEEEAAFLKQYLGNKIAALRQQFASIIDSDKAFDRQLMNLAKKIGTLTPKTPADVVDQWAEDLGVISMRLHKAGGVLPPGRSAPTPDRSEPRVEPRPTEPTTREPAARPRPEPVRQTPANLERQSRLAALEREIAELQRAAKLRKLDEIQREIELLRARRRS